MGYNFVRTNGKLIYKRVMDSQNGLYRKVRQVVESLSAPIETPFRKTAELIDDTLGVLQVNEAQKAVSAHESGFLLARDSVHELAHRLEYHREQLNETRKKLDRCDRSDERYLTFVADEHRILLESNRLQREYAKAEEFERRKFIEYSAAVRLSHEKERALAKRTRYWSIIGSIIGTLFGFMCSSLITHQRLKNVKDITQSAINEVVANILNDIETHRNSIIEEVQSLQATIHKTSSECDISSSPASFDGISEDVARRFDEQLKQVISVVNEIKKIQSINEKHLKTFTQELLNCLPLTENLSGYKQLISDEVEKMQIENSTSFHELSANLSKRVDETLKQLEHCAGYASKVTQTESAKALTKEEITEGASNYPLFNLLLATLTILALISCKNLF